MRSKILRGLGALAIIALPLTGCSQPDYDKYSSAYKMSDERVNESLADKINKIAVYSIFDKDRVINYQTFLDITGLKRELPESNDNSPLWIEVTPNGGVNQTVLNGRVRLDIPHDV